MKKLNQKITFPQTRFAAQIDAGAITGNLKLADATSTLKIGSLPLAKVTLAVEPTKPVAGRLTGLDVVANQEFNIHIKKIEPLGLPINLVGSNCRTATPVRIRARWPPRCLWIVRRWPMWSVDWKSVSW